MRFLLRHPALCITALITLLTPVLRAQPSVSMGYTAVSAELGQTVSLSMTAYGTAPLTYQWLLIGSSTTTLSNGTTANGSTLAGVTTRILTLSGTTAADAGNYALKVTDGNGLSITSQSIALSVKPPAAPVITTQPANVTVTAGNPASFSATATGSYPRTIQWYKGTPGSGTAVSGATSIPFSISYPLAADAGSYYVVITNGQGFATSTAATLTVNPATPITMSALNSTVTVTVGDSFTLYSNVYNGSSPITYQWTKGGTPITGATYWYYSVTSATTADAGTYAVVATNAAGSVTSSSCTVTVNAPVPPVFTQQPQSASLAYGDSLNLYVSASGTPYPTLQWYKDGTAIPGATYSNYYISKVTTADAGSYTAKATNSGGTVSSSAAVITVAAPVAPKITTQPATTTIPLGDSGSLSVSATGSAPFTYVWKKNGQVIANATSYSIYLSAVQSSDAGSYTVTITNAGGSVTSNAAVLTVGPATPPTFYSWGGGGSQTVIVGGSLTLSTPSLYAGHGPFTYQWYKDGTAISGATASSYTLSNAKITDSGSYIVNVTNEGGTTAAPAVTVTVNPPPGSGTAWIDAQQQGTVVYFLFSNHLERYDLSTSAYLTGVTFTQTATAFRVASDGVYIGFGRAVSRYSLDLSSQTTLANLAASTIGVFLHGSYVYAITGSTSYPIDRQTGAVGAAISTLYTSDTSIATVVIGDKLVAETYWGYSSFSFTATGSLTSVYNQYGTFPSAKRLYAYPDQTRVADNGGTVYNVSDDSVSGSFAGSFTDMTFLGDGTPVVLRSNVLTKYGGNGGYGETGRTVLTIQGMNIFANGTTITVFTPAASTANSYITATAVASSTLTAATPSAAVDPNGKTYTPNSIVQDENGVVYLLSQTHANIFRWSPTTKAYLTSIPLTGTPVSIAYSPTRHRLYCGYSSGTVTQVDTTASSPTEQPFGALPLGTSQIVAADDYVLGVAPSDETTVLNSSGRITYFADTYYYADPAYVWCASNQTFYSLNGAAKLSSAGKLGTRVSYLSGYANVSGAVFPSSDGALVLAANGPVFNGDLTASLGTIANSVADAVWIDGAPVTMHSGTAGTELQTWWPTNLKLFSSAQLPGTPKRLLPLSGSRLLLVTQSAGAPAFTILNRDLQVQSSTMALSTSGAPVITTQPAGSVSAFVGSSVRLAVDTTGATPQTYQWSKNGSPISGATSSVLAFSSLAATDAGNYTVTITNAAGSVTSTSATVGAYSALQITTQPQSQAIPYGTSGTLTVAIADGATASYQWYRNGTAISGATSSTLVTDKVYYTATGGDKYNVAVTNAAGTVLSSTAVITVTQSQLPKIDGVSYTSAAVIGVSAVFQVNASGTGPFTYQWYFNGTPISGATSATYKINSVTTNDSGAYSVNVANASGSVTSDAVFLTVGGMPTITKQPTGATVSIGSIMNFSVSATAVTAMTYQWYHDGQAIGGATNPSYSLIGVKPTDAGTYTVSVTNGAGSVSSTGAELIVTGGDAPTFTTQPASQEVDRGATASFSVVVSGTAPFKYQWYHDGQAIAGATGATLTVTNVTGTSVGLYTVTVTGSGGSRTSNGATLSIRAQNFAGAYFGAFPSGGRWAMYIGSDNTGTFVACLPMNLGSAVYKVLVDPNGVVAVYGSTATASTAVGEPPRAAAPSAISATISSGAISGTLDAIAFSGTKDAGGTHPAMGLYSAPALNGARGTTYTVVGGSGQAVVIAVSGSGADYATGTVDATGQLNAKTAGGSTVSTKIDTGTQLASTTITPPGSTTPVAYAGLGAGATSTARLLNVSIRGMAGSGSNVLIGGFAVRGGTKQILVRGVGPTLTSFGVTDALMNPQLSAFDVNSAPIWSGTSWGGGATLVSAFNRVGAFALTSTSADSANVLSVANNTTIQVTPASGAAGVALAEIYDADDNSSSGRLVNLSGRSNTGAGSAVLVAGFVIGGTGTETVLLRGIGPTLASYGVPGNLQSVQLTLFDGNNKPIAVNTNWGGDAALAAAFTQVGAFPLSPTSGDAALLVTLMPGSYTVQVAGINGGSGVALAEIYEVK